MSFAEDPHSDGRVLPRTVSQVYENHPLIVERERDEPLPRSVRDKPVAGAKAADEAAREHPYQAIAIGVGAGMIPGYLLARRCSRDRD